MNQPPSPAQNGQRHYLLLYFTGFILSVAYLYWLGSLIWRSTAGATFPIWVWTLTISPIALLILSGNSEKRRNMLKRANHLARCRANKEPHL